MGREGKKKGKGLGNERGVFIRSGTTKGQFSGYFQDIFRIFLGHFQDIFRKFSGNFQANY